MMEPKVTDKPLLICMCGLPRSGKSTIAKNLSRVLGAPIVNQDAIRLALHGQRFTIEAEPMVKAMALYMIKALFLTGHQVVICDETNYSRAARDSRRSEGWDVVFYHVDTPSAVCKARAVKTGQEDLVKVIDEMEARWEPFDPQDVTVWKEPKLM